MRMEENFNSKAGKTRSRIIDIIDPRAHALGEAPSVDPNRDWAPANEVVKIYLGQGGGEDNSVWPKSRPIILFDEVEKASDPAVSKALKDFLGQGKLTIMPGIDISGASNGGLLLNSGVFAGAEIARQRQAEAARQDALDKAVLSATVLQSPLTVGRPLSFRNKFLAL